MPAICLYFQVHQPYRLRRYSFFDLGFSHQYEDEGLNEEILHRVADRCYGPATTLMERLVTDTKGKFQVAFSLSGVVMDQLKADRPEIMASFKRLAEKKSVEFLGETYYHSLAGLYDEKEFERQVKKHRQALETHLGRKATTFRNTELLFWDALGKNLPGFKGALAEGVRWHLQDATPNDIYKIPNTQRRLLLRNAHLSDDISFRYSQHQHDVDGLLKRIAAEPGAVVNLFMDYETLGEHIEKDAGVFEFWEALVKKALEKKLKFVQPAQALEAAEKPVKLSIPTVTSWADQERDASAWNGNEMQRQALKRVYGLAPAIRARNEDALWDLWGRLQTSDHFYYMSTKHSGDQQVHDYFNPFSTPYDAYIHYMNVLSDLELRLK